MALLRCPDCGRDVSDVAPSCPGCGRPGYSPHHQQPHYQQPHYQQPHYQQPHYQQPIIAKPHWTQDRNIGCLAACILFLVLPVVFLMAMCRN